MLGIFFATYAMPALGALLVIFVAYIVSAWLSRAISRSLRKAKVDETWRYFLVRPSAG